MFSSVKRRLDPLDYVFMLWNGFMQYSIEFETPSAVPPALEEITRCVNAFRLKAGWVYLSATDQKPPIHKIPSNLCTLHDVNTWMFQTHTPKHSKSLGAIACDERRIVVNALHICGDGTFVSRLIEHLSDPRQYGTRKSAPVPKSSHYHFLDRIMQRKKGTTIVCGYDPNISRITPKRAPKVGGGEYKIRYIREPISALKCFNPTTGNCEKLTEALWLAMGLSNCAFGKSWKPFGVSTVFDLRRILTKSELSDPSIQNYIASIAVRANVSPEITVNELAEKLREDFQVKVADGEFFRHMRSVHDVIYKPWTSKSAAGLGLEVSSLGPIHIGSPVKDCHITLMAPGQKDLRSVSLMCYTLNHRERKTQEFVGQFQYTSKELHDLDGWVWNESIRYALKNMDGKATVGSAVNELEQFQKLIS
jgi:hypothetical protein